MKKGKVVSVSYWPVPLGYFEGPHVKEYLPLHGHLEAAAKTICESKPQTVIVMSQYKLTLDDAIGYSPQPRLQGVLNLQSGDVVKIGLEADSTFLRHLLKQGERMGIPLENVLENLPTISNQDYLLHHSAVIPLYYLQQAKLGAKQIVRLTMGKLSYEELYTFGKLIQLAAEASDRRVAVIGASNLLETNFVNRQDTSLDTNTHIMQALADRQPKFLQELGYPAEQEYAFRTAAFVLGAVSGLDATVAHHYYEHIHDVGHGLMVYDVKG